MEHQITCINCPVGCRMTVTVEDGSLLIIYPRETGFPTERVREAYT